LCESLETETKSQYQHFQKLEHGDSSNEELSSKESLGISVFCNVDSFSSSLEVIETVNGANKKVANPGNKRHDG
jgi:hypothetical protein